MFPVEWKCGWVRIDAWGCSVYVSYYILDRTGFNSEGAFDYRRMVFDIVVILVSISYIRVQESRCANM